jgi:hypothetical protein
MQLDASGLRLRVDRLTKVVLLATVTVSAGGCGNDLAQVTGAVTVDGQPLRGGGDVRATVIFQPATGDGRVAVGLVNADGRYRLSSGSQEGVVPGDYVATCSATKLVTNDGGVTGGRRLTDPIYANIKTSGLKFTVQPGKNEFDLALHSRPGTPSPRTAP